MPRTIRTVRDIRAEIAAHDEGALSGEFGLLLECTLPHNWRRLIAHYGRLPVFACLKNELTIGGSQRFLRESRTGQ